MRVLVCGGRKFSDRGLLYRTLDALKEVETIDCIIEGDARGADRMAGYWACRNHIDLRIFKAEWERFGDLAGPRRNQRMIDEGKPDLVVAFPGGHGTADMVRRAREANIEVTRVS